MAPGGPHRRFPRRGDTSPASTEAVHHTVDALAVILLYPAARAALEAADPMAVRQATAALRARLGEVEHEAALIRSILARAQGLPG